MLLLSLQNQGDRPRFKIAALEIAASFWNEPITITLEDCRDLMRFEMAFTRLLQIKQRPDLFGQDYYKEIRDGISNNNQNRLQPHKAPPPPQPQKKEVETTGVYEYEDDESNKKR